MDSYWYRRLFMRGTPIERFHDKIMVNEYTNCWIWCGSKNWGGYGRLSINGSPVLAHRWIFESVNGPIPLGKDIDHICRVRSCVNPDHLRIASRSQNMRNTEKHTDNRAGLKGVDLHKKTGKWRARVGSHHLGLFQTKEEAYEAYCIAAKEAYGDFWVS
jgi:hypothetical protein